MSLDSKQLKAEMMLALKNGTRLTNITSGTLFELSRSSRYEDLSPRVRFLVDFAFGHGDKSLQAAVVYFLLQEECNVDALRELFNTQLALFNSNNTAYLKGLQQPTKDALLAYQAGCRSKAEEKKRKREETDEKCVSQARPAIQRTEVQKESRPKDKDLCMLLVCTRAEPCPEDTEACAAYDKFVDDVCTLPPAKQRRLLEDIQQQQAGVRGSSE
jgi:hypothetical protein